MKKVLIIIALVMGIIIPVKTYALSDSFRADEYLPDAYIKKFRNGSGKYEQMRMFRRNSDNRLVYCIELWEDLNANKSIPGYSSNQASLSNMSDALWENVFLIAYYGYGYSNHTDIKWYTITQFMIWQTISTDSTIYFTDSLNGNRIDKYIDEINEINNLVNRHKLSPYISTLVDVKYNKKHTFNDRNNVISDYEIASFDNGVTVKKEANGNISFSTNVIGYSRFKLEKKDKLYSNNPIVYIDDSGQNILLPGSYPTKTLEIILDLRSKNIIINKTDSDTNLNKPSGSASFSGTKFELYDINHTYMKTIELNESGQAYLNNIGYGTYYLKEIKAGNGYTINNNEIEINVNNTSKSFNIPNSVIKNKIIINKYLKKNSGDIEKEEAGFIILDNKNNIIKEFTTVNGIYELELAFGNYTLKQVSGTPNYKYIDDININVEENNKVLEFNLYNEELIVPVKINNTDNESNLNILESGATFIIKNIDTLEERMLSTNNNGETITIDLVPGNYEIKQLTSVDNYKVNENTFNIEINDNNFNYNKEVFNIDIPNEKEKVDLEVDKIIKNYLDDKLIDTKKEDNIDINIYAGEDIYTKDGKLIYTKNEQVPSRNLVYGNYYINNPVNNEPVTIYLNSKGTKKIEILEENYKYTKLDNIPNTYTTKKKSSITSYIILLGLILIYRGKKYEKD